MKLKLLLILSLSFILISGFHKNSAAESTEPVDQIAVSDSLGSMTSNVDGIEIPMKVLMQIQIKYQGYAVTKAKESNSNGKQAYQLLVDNNDQANDYNGFYLLYDKNWQFLNEQKLPAPPAPKPSPQTQPEAPKPDEPVPAPAPSTDQGGRGAAEQPTPTDSGNKPNPSNTTTPPPNSNGGGHGGPGPNAPQPQPSQ
jgi:outer membrane biosynthesis protein TonB